MTKAISVLSRIAGLIGTMAIYASCTYGVLSFVDMRYNRYLRNKARAEELLSDKNFK